MQEIKRIHHIAVLVDNIEASLKFWHEILGIEASHISDVPKEAARVTFLPLGESEIELVQPATSDSGLSRFLEKHGPGMHHLCLEVDDLPRLLIQLKTMGVLLINDEPKVSEDGRMYAFIHPKSSDGVLVELYQLPE
ncbi:MAG: methylmalonyl-CoA epimerase [Chloroflexi bacterium RBG_19FT_COMBO_50_10]|nr:MAG: methylmalonyl-CoA epimerase [Chloroflexi bacterium RBG_19FT_COMBO_50_10]